MIFHTVMGEILGGHAKPIIGIPIYDEHTNQIEWIREKKLGLFAQNRMQIIQAVREIYENYELMYGAYVVGAVVLGTAVPITGLWIVLFFLSSKRTFTLPRVISFLASHGLSLNLQ